MAASEIKALPIFDDTVSTPSFSVASESGKNPSTGSTIRCPANLVSGQYDVLLALPDPAPSLHDRPAYAIQLANQNVWEDRTGFNALGQTINIQP